MTDSRVSQNSGGQAQTRHSDIADAESLVFSGCITPLGQAHIVNFYNILQVVEPKFGAPDQMIFGTAEVEISDGKLTCKLSKEIIHNTGDTGLYKLRGTVNSIVRFILDAVNFSTGTVLDVEVDRVYHQDSEIYDFSKNTLPLPSMEQYFQEVNRSEWGEKILRIGNVYLRHALADFRRAMKYQDEAAMHCYRAIESIRQHFLEGLPGTVSPKQRVKESWIKMRSELNLEESWLKQFLDIAESQRHGQLVDLKGIQVLTILDISWVTIKRYIDYLELRDAPSQITLE